MKKIEWQTIKFGIQFVGTILGYIGLLLLVVFAVGWYVKYKGWV